MTATDYVSQMVAAVPFEGCSGPDDDWNWTWTVPGCDEPTPIVPNMIKDSIFEPFVEDAKNGVADSIKAMMTFWVQVPAPTVSGPGSTGETIGFIRSNLAWLAAVILVFAIIFGGIQMMFQMSGKPVIQIIKAIILYILVSSALVGGVAALLAIASGLSDLFLGQAAEGTNFADNLFSLFDTTAGVASGILLIFLFIIAMFLSAIMCGVMIARGALMIVLLGTIIVTVAASNSDTGMQAFKTQLAWIAGWIAIAPTAAIIYGAGFKLMGTDAAAQGNSLLQILYGLSLIFLAIMALPAIMRLVHPIVTPASGGGGFGSTVAGAGMVLASAGLRR